MRGGKLLSVLHHPIPPDFFIVGAMRAGTTSLHHMLASHPRIFLPRRELFFFDSDDFEEHAEEHRAAGGGWRHRDFDAELPEALPAYQALFREAGDCLIGEDSTTYLTAAAAPARIAAHRPDAHIVVSLRDPVMRAWSHYWHLVCSGRMVLSFEDALLSQRGTLLKRSDYATALARWRQHFPPDQIHVLLFEELIAEPQPHLDRICAALGVSPLDAASLPASDRHRHRARLPARPVLQLAANWLRRQSTGRRALPGPTTPGRRGRRGPAVKLLERLAGRDQRAGTPPIGAETRQFLDDLFRRQAEPLAALVGRSRSELAVHWPCMAR